MKDWFLTSLAVTEGGDLSARGDFGGHAATQVFGVTQPAGGIASISEPAALEGEILPPGSSRRRVLNALFAFHRACRTSDGEEHRWCLDSLEWETPDQVVARGTFTGFDGTQRFRVAWNQGAIATDLPADLSEGALTSTGSEQRVVDAVTAFARATTLMERDAPG